MGGKGAKGGSGVLLVGAMVSGCGWQVAWASAWEAEAEAGDRDGQVFIDQVVVDSDRCG